MALAAGGAGCSNVVTAPDGTRLDGPHHVTALIDGHPWVAASQIGEVNLESGARRFVRIDAVSHSDGATTGLILALDTPEIGRPLTLGPGGRGVAGMVTNDPENWTARVVGMDSTTGGMATVTVYDPINRVIGGTFEFSGRLMLFRLDQDTIIRTVTDTIVHVTEGRFLVPFD